MSTKKIEFTSEQFTELLKVVYLGHWMANSHRDEPNNTFEEIEQHIYSNAHSFGLNHYIEFDQESQKYLPSPELEEETDPIIEDYDDNTFWDELAWRMAERDFSNKYDEAKVLCMTGDEIFREKNTLADKYFEEFSTNGIQKMMLK
jgi:hypothetical protein